MILKDWELWACAQNILKDHCGQAPLHAAKRVEELTSAGDKAGAATWLAIADRVDQLMDFRNGQPLRVQ